MTRFDPEARPDPDARSDVNALGQEITPIEAVIDAKSTKKLHAQAELTEQIIAERQARAKEPVHMEGLKPLPADMPRLPNGVIPGGPGALGMVPSMRRSIPAPFQRQRIAIDHHGKTWGYATAATVEAGDIVVDFGRVGQVHQQIVYEEIAGIKAATGEQVILVNAIDGKTIVVDPSEQLRVFRVHDQEES